MENNTNNSRTKKKQNKTIKIHVRQSQNKNIEGKVKKEIKNQNGKSRHTVGLLSTDVYCKR